MPEQILMPIREFSRQTGIRSETLRFYDNEGLLSPELRGENGYRYYSNGQLDLAFLISDLRVLNVPLKQIKQYANQRSPEGMLALFDEQNQRIEKEIAELKSMQKLMNMRTIAAKKALEHEADVAFLEQKEEEKIFLCPPILEGQSEEDCLLASFNYALSNNVSASFPFGTLIAPQVLTNYDTGPTQFYFKFDQPCNGHKSSGLYAAIYGYGNYVAPESTYKKLFAFLLDNGLSVKGNVYEEYPLDELATNIGELKKIRVEVQVERI